MPVSVLVAYATRYGSTQQVAESIAATLREHGLGAELAPARQVQTLEGYRGVVLGAPLFMFHWHKDALRFLSRHQPALTKNIRVAIFALGPLGSSTAQEWQQACNNLDQELAPFSWLTPAAVQVFGGKLDPAQIRFPMSLFLKQMPASDARDWSAIRAWAGELAARFQPA